MPAKAIVVDERNTGTEQKILQISPEVPLPPPPGCTCSTAQLQSVATGEAIFRHAEATATKN